MSRKSHKKTGGNTATLEEPQEEKKFNRELDRFFKHDNDLEYEIILYRLEGPKRKKCFVDSWDSEPPHTKEIAEQYGPGDYLFWAVDPTNNDLLQKSLHIGEDWRARHENYLKAQEELTAPAQVPASSPHVDPLDQMKAIASIMKDLLPQAPAQPQNPFDALPSFLNSMTKSYTESISQMGNKMLENQLAAMETDEKEDREEMTGDIKSEIVQMIVQFGKTLLNAKGKKQEQIQQLIENDPRFKQVNENKELYSAIYTELCKHKKVGKSEAGKIFKKFGFSVPA